MKRIALIEPRRFEVQEVEQPAPGPGEALVRIGKVGVCGSDVHLFQKGRIGDIVVEEPFVIGHECMGVIEDVGEGVDRDRIGRRVGVEPAIPCGRCRWCLEGTCNICPTVGFLGLPPVHGAFREYIAHPAHLLEDLPDEIDDGAAVVLEPLAIALNAVQLVKVKPGHRVAILGTGVLGTCVLEVLRLYRGLHVVCVDLAADRLERAQRMGAHETIQAGDQSDDQIARQIRSALGGEGADVVFECAGAAQTIWNMAEVAGPAGHISAIGSSHDDRIVFSSGSARRKGLTIRYVRRSLHTLGPCIELVRQGELDPAGLVTDTFKASDITRAFELVESQAEGVLKGLVNMERW
jgi:L-iditol 2-dehydrogenase